MTDVLMTRVVITCGTCGIGATMNIYKSTCLRNDAGDDGLTLCESRGVCEWCCDGCMTGNEHLYTVCDEEEDGWDADTEDIGLEEDEDEDEDE